VKDEAVFSMATEGENRERSVCLCAGSSLYFIDIWQRLCVLKACVLAHVYVEI
jgi:hypothetical protein